MHRRLSLDGMWEFSPEQGDSPPPAEAARATLPAGYEAARIHVPGYWNTFPDAVGGDWGAYACYDYPAAWQQAASAWYRLRFMPHAPPDPPTERTRLCFDAVTGTATVWLNGTPLGQNTDSFLPFAYDVTDVLRPQAENELVVHVGPPPKAGDLWLQPCGSWAGWHLRGIWQSVYLQTGQRAAVADVFVQPSVRHRKLVVDVELDLPPEVPPSEVHVVVRDGARVVLDLGRRGTGAAPVLRFEADWPDPRCWSPEDPHLYHAVAELHAGGRLTDRRTVRFGFREFWIEGTGFRLNGRPIRLFGDAWHYMGTAQQNPAYARTWFELAQATGVNAIRTHAMPYPPFYFDLADERGMLIVDESAVYGSAGTLAYAEPQFWENCRDHLRRLVRRDRNHPSIVFWSVCNETVWKGGEAIFDGLLSLADEARRHDPTRFVSFDENDCDLGGQAAVHAGHYGAPEHWERLWKRDRPLVIHEFSTLYHGGPDDVCGVGGDVVYADYAARLNAAGEDAAAMFLRLRSLGAASITPWNIVWYALEPLPIAAVDPVPATVTEGGAPLERIGPRALTLNYGYVPNAPHWKPNPAYAPLAACYRRRRFFLRWRPRQGWAGQKLEVAAEVWNDHHDPLAARLTLRQGKAVAAADVTLAPCETRRVTLTIALPAVAAHERLMLELALTAQTDGHALHAEAWPVYVYAADALDVQGRRRVASEPDDLNIPRMLTHGTRPVWPVGNEPLRAVISGPDSTLVLGGEHGGRTLRHWLERDDVDAWLRSGGRLVVLPGGLAEDLHSALNPIRRECLRVFPREFDAADWGLLRGLTAEHFAEWGPNGVVAETHFRRPATGPALALLDVGDPAEGIVHTPLLILPHGRGHVVFVGMDLLGRAADTPTAALLLVRLLHEDWPPAPQFAVTVVGRSESTPQLFDDVGVVSVKSGSIVICDGGCAAALDDPALHAAEITSLLADGGTLLVQNVIPATADAWAERLGLPLRVAEDERCNVACAGAHELLEGLNNFDFCWVCRDERQPIVRHTLDALPQGRTLLQTVATRWEDYQTAAEQHKVGLMLRRIESFAGPRAAVIEVRRGAGRILLSQLLLGEARGQFAERARRILSRWLDVLGAARDPRVSPLAPQARTTVRSDGYITQWLVLGPYTGAAGHPLDHPFIDEPPPDPQPGSAVGEHSWQRVDSAFAQVDVARAFEVLPPRDRVAYAAMYVYSPRDRSVLLDAPEMLGLRLGADGGAKVWLNGGLLGRFDFVRELVLDNDRMDSVPLRKGWNTLVIKLHNPSGRWRFAVRFLTAMGTLAAELTTRLEP